MAGLEGAFQYPPSGLEASFEASAALRGLRMRSEGRISLMVI